MSETDALGHTTEYRYDDLDRQTDILRPDPVTGQPSVNQLTRFEYDVGGALTVGNLTKVWEACETPAERIPAQAL